MPSGLKWGDRYLGAAFVEDGKYVLHFSSCNGVGHFIYGDCIYSNAYYQYTPGAGGYKADITHDGAMRYLGNGWRMPTINECQELISNTTQELYTQNNVKGVLFTSKVNGKAIFFANADDFRENEVLTYEYGAMMWVAQGQRYMYTYLNNGQLEVGVSSYFGFPGFPLRAVHN